MKKILLGILLIGLSIIMVGCGKQKDMKMYINCNEKEETINLKYTKAFECTLTNTTYNFNISRINNDEITIKTDKIGLSRVRNNNTISLRERQKVFTMNKKQELILRTQTTDYSEELKITIK